MFRDQCSERGHDILELIERARPGDVVFHLAGYVGGIGANKAFPADFFYRNLMLGVHVLHYAWKTGAEKVIAAGVPMINVPDSARAMRSRSMRESPRKKSI